MDKDFAGRLRVMTITIIVALLVIVFRLGVLQIVFGAEYRRDADENRFRQRIQLAPRGQILDSRGIVMAGNQPGFFVSMYHTRAPELDKILKTLTGILDPLGQNPDISVERFKRLLNANRFRRWQPVRLTETPLQFGDPVLLEIDERRLELPGVFIDVQPVRSYPLGSLASHVLGGLGRFTGDQQALRSLINRGLMGYRLDSRVGRWGIEAAFEFVPQERSLRGIDGLQRVEVDQLSRIVAEKEPENPTPGSAVKLTIDAELQQIVETWLINEYLPMLQKTAPAAREVAVVALDPRDGRVRAFISLPSFDPALIARDFVLLRDDADQPLVAKPLAATVPGSMFKPVTQIVGIMTGATEAMRGRPPVVCTGRLFNEALLGPRGKRCWIEAFGTGHGVVDELSAMRISCNIYFYQLGFEIMARLGVANVLDSFGKVAATLGLGVPTRIPELVDFRADVGQFPTSERFRDGIRAHLRRNPGDRRSLNPFPGEVADIAIGQGDQQYTPLQMANFMAMLATGHRFQPFLVERVVAPSGEIIEQNTPKLLASLVKTADNPAGLITEPEWRRIQEGLRQVTQVTGLGLNSGTAAGVFRGAPYFSAGKTGTAEVMRGGVFVDSHGWFAGYAAVDALTSPEIVVSVLVKHGRSGGGAAAPIARKVFNEYFRLKLERAGQ
ncbi:MAG: Peptidoglycan D,D-transpeptidase MrdA [Firmicutes bacterium]|nr:Peptidoglycan D,D-transpeptidase MrdA [Bacillota bacterium]